MRLGIYNLDGIAFLAECGDRRCQFKIPRLKIEKRRGASRKVAVAELRDFSKDLILDGRVSLAHGIGLLDCRDAGSQGHVLRTGRFKLNFSGRCGAFAEPGGLGSDEFCSRFCTILRKLTAGGLCRLAESLPLCGDVF